MTGDLAPSQTHSRHLFSVVASVTKQLLLTSQISWLVLLFRSVATSFHRASSRAAASYDSATVLRFVRPSPPPLPLQLCRFLRHDHCLVPPTGLSMFLLTHGNNLQSICRRCVRLAAIVSSGWLKGWHMWPEHGHTPAPTILSLSLSLSLSAPLCFAVCPGAKWSHTGSCVLAGLDRSACSVVGADFLLLLLFVVSPEDVCCSATLDSCWPRQAEWYATLFWHDV